MQYHLIFERFLNPERVSMPDFDIGLLLQRRRGEVIDYVMRQIRRGPCGTDRDVRHHGRPAPPSATSAAS